MFGRMHWVAVSLLLGALALAVLNAILAINFFPVSGASKLQRYFKRGVSSVKPNIPVENIFMKGEVLIVKNGDFHSPTHQERPGLQVLPHVFGYFTRLRSLYSSPSPQLHLLRSLKSNLEKNNVTSEPWQLAAQWASSTSIIPLNAVGLGDILDRMRSSTIVAADIGYKGTQLKITLTLKGGQRAVFKPMWTPRDKVVEGDVYSGPDRHNGEVVAFHLSRLLDLPLVPISTGRRVSLRKEILPVASHKLANTFLRKGFRTCFYGVCYYCKEDNFVCDDGKALEGSVSLWLPENLRLLHLPHPWARTYKDYKLAKWETSANHCSTLHESPFFIGKDSQRLLDLIDVSIFDFLIQNGDRHHYNVIAGYINSSVIILDNGKSFGNPFIDHLDILAPLIQCCRLRQKTYDRLLLLSGGGLSLMLDDLLSTDALSPLLTDLHLKAMDRRLWFVLSSVAMCKDRMGWNKVLV